MQIEVLTKDDLEQLTETMINMQNEMKTIRTLLSQKQDDVLDSKQIMQRLGISYSTLMKRRPELTQFGMFSDGKIKMRASELDRYIEFKKNF